MVMMGVAVVFLNLSNNAVHLSLKLGEKEVEIVYVCTYNAPCIYINMPHFNTYVNASITCMRTLE